MGSQRGMGKRVPSDSLAALVPPDGEHLLEKKTPMPKTRRQREWCRMKRERWGREKSATRKHKIGKGRLLVREGKEQAIRVRGGMD